MPYELTFEQRPEYLYAHLQAEATDVDKAVRYWQNIVDKCRELDFKRLLVVQEIPGGLSVTDTFLLATKVAAMGINGIKLAFVDPETHLYETHQFGQMAAGNRGVWVEVFTTIPEAENWLLQPMGSSLTAHKMDLEDVE